MKSILRENPTIAFGLGLPFLFALVFLSVSWLPALFVAAPQYDVLYATGYNDYAGRSGHIRISVVQEKVKIRYDASSDQRRGASRVQLWRYSAATGAVKELAFDYPFGDENSQPKVGNKESKETYLDHPELVNVRFDSSSMAPDGYTFSSDGRGYSRDIFFGLFGGYSYRRTWVLTKDGREIRLPQVGSESTWMRPHFIAWIIPQ